MKFKYTVCFLKQDNNILMLNREKVPLMGVWNGLGGKIEEGESPDAAAMREVLEETDIMVENYFSKSTVTWETSKGQLDGLHVYLYELDDKFKYETPKKMREGILDWKPIDWVLDPNNLGIPEKVPQYLPVLLKYEGNHFLKYKNGQIMYISN